MTARRWSGPLAGALPVLLLAVSSVAAPARAAAPVGGCGPTWTQVPTPSPGNESSGLSAVLALSPTNAWAAGFRLDRSRRTTSGSSGTPAARPVPGR